MKTYSLKKQILLSVLILGLISICFSLVFNSERVYAMEKEELISENSVNLGDYTQQENEEVILSSGTGRSSCEVLISGANSNADPFTTAPASDLSDKKYIPNANYFLINPSHHRNDGSDNWAGTCTTVAVQMLLGYHNYYSDRRIIPTTGNGRVFLDADYGNLNSSPAFSRAMVAGQGCKKIGTEDGVYEEVFELANWAEFPALGQTLNNIKNGVAKFIEKFTPKEARNGISLTYDGSFSVDEVHAEIDAGRPIVLGMNGLLRGKKSFHVVVAYG